MRLNALIILKLKTYTVHCVLNASFYHVKQKPTILKVEAVEVGALHQVAQRLRLKGCEARITYLPGIERNTYYSHGHMRNCCDR